MKKSHLLALAIPAIMTMNGCMESEAPKCSNDEVIKTVKNLYSGKVEEMGKNIFTQVLLASIPKEMTGVTSTRAVPYDEKVHLRTCKAEAELGAAKIPIEYTVQLTEKKRWFVLYRVRPSFYGKFSSTNSHESTNEHKIITRARQYALSNLLHPSA